MYYNRVLDIISLLKLRKEMKEKKYLKLSKMILSLGVISLITTGCLENVKQVQMANGQHADEWQSLGHTNDPKHILNYEKMSYKYKIITRAKMLNVPGSKIVTLKVKRHQVGGRDFSLHPMALNGIKPISCKSGKKPGYAVRTLECTYNKAALRNTILNRTVVANGMLVDESPNGTLSEAWKCSKKYGPKFYATKNIFKRMSIRSDYGNECLNPHYFNNQKHFGVIGDKALLEDYFTYRMAAYGNKHYRFAVDEGNKEFLKFLSK
jgi:hypothetical protein